MPKTIFLPTANNGTDGSNILIADDVDAGDVVNLPQDGVSYDAFQRVATGIVQTVASGPPQVVVTSVVVGDLSADQLPVTIQADNAEDGDDVVVTLWPEGGGAAIVSNAGAPASWPGPFSITVPDGINESCELVVSVDDSVPFVSAPFDVDTTLTGYSTGFEEFTVGELLGTQDPNWYIINVAGGGSFMVLAGGKVGRVQNYDTMGYSDAFAGSNHFAAAVFDDRGNDTRLLFEHDGTDVWDNCYHLTIGDNEVTLRSREGGVDTTLGTRTIAYDPAHVYRLDRVGDDILIRVNGIQLGAAITDTTHRNGHAAAMLGGPAPTMTNFEIGPL